MLFACYKQIIIIKAHVLNWCNQNIPAKIYHLPDFTSAVSLGPSKLSAEYIFFSVFLLFTARANQHPCAFLCYSIEYTSVKKGSRLYGVVNIDSRRWRRRSYCYFIVSVVTLFRYLYGIAYNFPLWNRKRNTDILYGNKIE